MVRARPVLVYSCNVRGSAVAFVLFKIVEGMLLVYLSHDAISGYLGTYGRCGNDELDAITFNH
jgi:hypothetical protein